MDELKKLAAEMREVQGHEDAGRSARNQLAGWIRRLDAITEPEKAPGRVWVVWVQRDDEQRIRFVFANEQDALACEGASGVVRFDVYGAPEPVNWDCDECEDTMEQLRRERDEAIANYQFMVNRAADEKLDGYRELGATAAAAEAARDDALGRVKELEDERDLRIANAAIAAIQADPSKLVGGEELERRLGEMECGPVSDTLRSCDDCATAYACCTDLTTARKWGTLCDEFEQAIQNHVERALDWYERGDSSSDDGIKRALIAAIKAISDRVAALEEKP